METLNNNQQTTGLQTFFNDGINAGIRMKMIDGESWFIAKDICCALGLQDVSMTVKRLDDDEKLIQTLFVSGQGRETWTVNESGLYGLIFLSRKPEAKAFRKWVTNEVLPSIRRTGAYSVCPTQRPTLPAPKFRPDFIEWKQAVCRYLNRNDLKTVATNMKVTYSHVCKVYSGNTMSRRIADRLTKLAISPSLYGEVLFLSERLDVINRRPGFHASPKPDNILNTLLIAASLVALQETVT